MFYDQHTLALEIGDIRGGASWRLPSDALVEYHILDMCRSWHTIFTKGLDIAFIYSIVTMAVTGWVT